jgi:hypothetical protein
MVRALLRLILVIVVVVGVGAFLIGYRWGDPDPDTAERPVATTGEAPPADTAKARETGARIGETVAVGANKAERALEGASLTAKIKAKMTLDDTVQAARIDIDTEGDVVTLSGTVRSDAERARALQLARETEGVRQVVDHLRVRNE